MKTDLEDELAAEPDAIDDILESAPEEERWDPIGGSTGGRNLPLYEDGEDEDGNPQGVQLVATGVEAAEFDQMLQAEKADPDVDELSDQGIEKQTDEDLTVLEKDTDELSDQGIGELDDGDDELDDDEEELEEEDEESNA